MTKGSITKEALETRLYELVTERDKLKAQAEANLNAFEGAINILKELLALPPDQDNTKTEK